MIVLLHQMQKQIEDKTMVSSAECLFLEALAGSICKNESVLSSMQMSMLVSNTEINKQMTSEKMLTAHSFLPGPPGQPGPPGELYHFDTLYHISVLLFDVMP